MTRRLVAWAFIAAGIVYVLFIGGAPAGIELPEIRLISALISAVAFLAWGFAAWRDPSWRPRSILLPGILACLGSIAISTVASRAPRVSVEYLVYATILAGLYLLLVRLMAQPFFRDRIVAIGALSGLAIAGLFVVVSISQWVRFWGLLGRFTTPPLRPGFETLVYGNPALILVLVVLLGAVAVGWAYQVRGLGSRAAAAIVGLDLVAVTLSGARGGWAAIAAGLLVIAVIRLVRWEGPKSLIGVIRSSASRRRLVLVGAVLTIVAASAVVLAPGLLRRIGAGGEEVRGTFYGIALRLFGEAPALGAGPGMWAADRISYTEPSQLDHYVPHAHNLYLQGLAEMGLIGLVAGLVAAGPLVWLLRDALRDVDPLRRRWGWIATFTVVYFATHHLVDFYVNSPVALLASAIPIAILDGTASRIPARLPWGRLMSLDRRSGLTVGMIAMTGALGAAIWFEIPALRHADAVKLANQGRWETASPVAELAIAMDPDMPIYQLTAGLAAAHLRNYESAAEHFRVIALAGDLPEAWLDLADAEWHLGDQAAARDALVRALRLGYQRASVAVPAADLALRLGDDALAVGAITQALVYVPSLAALPWWTEEPARATAFSQGVAAATALGGPGLGWELATQTGDLERARSESAMLPDDLIGGAQDVISAWSGNQEALSAVEDRCVRLPLDWTVPWCARLAAKFGSDEDRFVELGRIVGWDEKVLRAIRIEPDPGPLTAAPDSAYLYGIDAYRRFIPWDIVAPGLIHLTLQ